MKSPLRWPGGKARIADAILSHMGPHLAYVEACCGGAAVFWAKPREASKAEVLNDADGELINFYRVLHRRGRRLAREVDAMPYSRMLFDHQRSARPASQFARAARFWYINRVGFGAVMDKPSFGGHAIYRCNVLPARILQDLDLTIERLRGVSFENIDVVRLIGLYDRPTTFFYVDPPYYDVAKGLYAQPFGTADHTRLAECLKQISGRFILSYDDCPCVRGLYRTCHMAEVTMRYSIRKGPRRKTTELLISNRPLRQAK